MENRKSHGVFYTPEKFVKHIVQDLDPEIWSRLPCDLVEHIAHFSDIDTRRAMGFGPRKIVFQHLNIHTPKQVGNVTLVKLADGAEIIYDSDSYIFTPRRDRITFAHQRSL